MKKLFKKFKLYIPFSKAGIKRALVYKAQIFMWLFISFVDVFFVIFLYQAIYRNSENGISSIINGFTFYEMVLYMVTSFVFSFVINGSDTTYNIFNDIKEGTIVNTLTKPISYRAKHLFTYLGSLFFEFLIIVLPLLVVIYTIFITTGLVEINLMVLIPNAIIFILLTLVAGLINDAINYFVGLMTFYTEHVFGLDLFKSAVQGFLSGTLLPLSYMGLFGVICSYTPFAFLNSTPVLTLLGKIEISNSLIYILIAMVWWILLELINKLVFNHCIKKVVVQGG